MRHRPIEAEAVMWRLLQIPQTGPAQELHSWFRLLRKASHHWNRWQPARLVRKRLCSRCSPRRRRLSNCTLLEQWWVAAAFSRTGRHSWKARCV